LVCFKPQHFVADAVRDLHVKSECVKGGLLVLRAILAPGLMVLALTAAANAGPFKDAAAAHRKADTTALRIVRPLARKGYAPAQLKLGLIYAKGTAVPRDYREALRWYRKAADQGNAAAQRSLGVMLAKGLGGPQDYAEASKWFHKAAEQNDAAAQTNLGVMYDFGHGVVPDHAEALKWYRKAANGGNAEARYNLGVMYEQGDSVLQNCVEAARWYRLAADQGYAAAQSNLGAMYDRGEGVRQNYREALKWYRKAAEQGDSTAQYNIGSMYVSGQGVPQDDVAAHLWFSLSAARGDEDAARNRDLITQRMTLTQIGEAQKLAREWKPKPQGDQFSDMLLSRVCRGSRTASLPGRSLCSAIRSQTEMSRGLLLPRRRPRIYSGRRRTYRAVRSILVPHLGYYCRGTANRRRQLPRCE
jgi:TPR repeat protein